MKILILHAFYAQPGGEDAAVLAELRGLQARGHEVRLFSLNNADISGSAWRGAWAAFLVTGNPWVAGALRREIALWRPDIAHVHNIFPRLSLAVFEVLASLGVPTVQTLHNYRWLCAKATFLRDGAECRLCSLGDHGPAVRYACFRHSRLLSFFYKRALERNHREGVAAKAVGRYLCVSEFVRQAYLNAGYDPDRLLVKGHFVEAVGAARPAGDGSVLYVGRLSEEKGFHVLAAALKSLPELRLSVAGGGPEQAGWQARLGSRVRWLGHLEPEELRAEYARASACVVPSTGLETFGRTVIEAYACGRPVVASATGGLPELVQDGVTGLLARPGDAGDLAAKLSQLLEDPARTAAMGEAGKRLVQERYLAGPSLAQLEEAYRQAVAA